MTPEAHAMPKDTSAFYAMRQQQYERRQHALRMRENRVTFALIAAELGVSVHRAREIVKAAKRDKNKARAKMGGPDA